MMISPAEVVIGEWRSLVAHLLWEQRVAGSNPVSPTINAARQSGGLPRPLIV